MNIGLKSALMAAVAVSATQAHAGQSKTEVPAKDGSRPPAVPTTISDAQADAADIVVTAQRRSQRLQDVPISASVVSGPALERANITQLSDLSNRLPNVKIAAGPSSNLINIRGIGSGNSAGFEQAVGTFVDGLYRGRSLSASAALFDVESVEVLKGPQSTFFGNNTVAGALNITTRKPTKQFVADASVLYGTQGEYEARASVGGPVTSTLRLRAAVGASGMKGYAFNEATNAYGPHLRDLLGRVSMVWEPSSSLEVTARVDHGRLRDTEVFDTELINCPPAAIYGAPKGVCARSLALSGGALDDKLNHRTYNGPSYFNYDFTEGLLSTRANLGNQTLTLLGGYFDHDVLQSSNVTPGIGGSAIGSGYGLTIPVPETFRQYSGEVRLESNQNSRVSYMIGAYWAHNKLNVRTDVGYYFAPLGLAAGLPATTRVAGQIFNYQTQTTKSAFGSLSVALTQKLRLNLGARYSVVEKYATRSAQIGTAGIDPDPSNFVPLPAATQALLSSPAGLPLGDYRINRRTDRRFMPSVGVQYSMTDNSMAYATVTTGFKSGGFGFSLSSDVFGPERVTSYEVGVKGSYFDRALTIAVAGFHAQYSDLQESTNLVIGNKVTTLISNAAKAVSQGVESSLVARLSPSFTISADVAYLSSKYKDFRNAGCTSLQNLVQPCVQDVSGKTRAYSPKFSGNISISYSRQVGDNLILRFEPSVYFTSEYLQQPTLDPLTGQKGYAKVDATLSLGRIDRRWEIDLVGRNLTDIITAGYRVVVASTSGSASGLAERPRSVVVRLSTHF